MNSNNNECPKNPLALDHSQSSVVKLEEYYENIGEEEDLKNSDKGDIEVDPEREEMENDYELMKNLNDLKERNKKLESINKYQGIKIESLESELEKTLNKLNLKEAEIEEIKNSNNNQGKSSQNRTASYVAQINNLNLQIDKCKGLLNEKKNEYNAMLEKYNEVQKKLDQSLLVEKKNKQELISKDKQIAKLIEELDKKNIVISSSTTQQIKEKENEKLIQENKKLEKQKNEIYAAFKKSLKLCSILKREKVHLENARLLAFTEDEFKNLLEQNKI